MKKRVSYISGLLIVLLYSVFTLLALTKFKGVFSPSQNWLSDLGSPALNPRGYFFYNTGIVLTGILLIIFFWGLSIWKKPGNKRQNIMLLLAGLFGSLGGLSMILSAVFPINIPAVHSIFSTALYILTGTGFVFSVVSLLYYPKFPRWMFGLGILVGVEDMLWGMVFNIYVMEFITVGLFLVFTLLLGLHTRVREKFI